MNLELMKKCQNAIAAAVACGNRSFGFQSTSGKDLNSGNLPELLREVTAAVEETERTMYGSPNPLKIKRWLSTGELDKEELPADIGDVYDAAGELLDASQAYEIFGTLVFEAENGKFYEVNVEGALTEDHPDDVHDLLAAAGGQDPQ